MVAINPAPHTVGQHSSKSTLNSNWALVLLMQQAIDWTSQTRTITAASYTILSTDTIVYVNRLGAVTLTLPDAAAWLAAHAGGQLIIQDISGAAASNNITVARAGIDVINGSTSRTISANYGGLKLRPAANNLWVIQ